MRHLAYFLLLLLFSGCAPRRAAAPASPTAAPSYEASRNWEEVRQTLSALSGDHRELLGSDFFTTFTTRTEDPLFRVKLAETGHFPLFPGYPVTLHMKSKYDKQPLTFVVRAPLVEEQQGVTLLLGGIEQYQELLSDRSYKGWLVHIPSRPHLNHQLTAEGDFWQSLKTLTALYPQLQEASTYLVGTDQAADAALLLANHYRYRFSGVAISGGSLGLDLPNLDYLPIASFGHSKARTPWGGHHLVERIAARGNDQTFSQAPTLSEALAFLQAQKPASYSPFVFRDGAHGQIWPGVKTLSRLSEMEAVTATASLNGDVLQVNALNITSLRIDPKRLPEGVHQVLLNDERYLLPKSKSLVQIGEETLPKGWKRKGDTPSGLVNFFRGEPVMVVYQDEAGERFSEVARNTAEQIAALHFTGLPNDLEIHLPVMKLSQYLEGSHSPHRLILVATSDRATDFLQESEGYLPFASRGTTFSLVYPPENRKECLLTWVLASTDPDSLVRLTQERLTLTALFSNYDLAVYPSDREIVTRTFDSYWGNSNSSRPSFTIPRQSLSAWQSYLEDMLFNEFSTPAMILSPLAETHVPPPTQLSPTNLHRFLPERHFAVVTLRASASATVANKLLSATESPLLIGLDNFLTDGQFDPIKLRKKQKRVVIDAAALSSLSEEERSALHYEILPHSLHELFDLRLQADANAVGRSLIRLGQSLEGDFFR